MKLEEIRLIGALKGIRVQKWEKFNI